MSSELVASIAVGGLIGYGLDRWLGTSPWLFLVFFLLGFAAGILSVLRAYRQMQSDIASQTGGRIGRSVPDDD
jgi:ATP synthase protein I